MSEKPTILFGMDKHALAANRDLYSSIVPHAMHHHGFKAVDEFNAAPFGFQNVDEFNKARSSGQHVEASDWRAWSPQTSSQPQVQPPALAPSILPTTPAAQPPAQKPSILSAPAQPPALAPTPSIFPATPAPAQPQVPASNTGSLRGSGLPSIEPLARPQVVNMRERDLGGNTPAQNIQRAQEIATEDMQKRVSYKADKSPEVAAAREAVRKEDAERNKPYEPNFARTTGTDGQGRAVNHYADESGKVVGSSRTLTPEEHKADMAKKRYEEAKARQDARISASGGAPIPAPAQPPAPAPSILPSTPAPAQPPAPAPSILPSTPAPAQPPAPAPSILPSTPAQPPVQKPSILPSTPAPAQPPVQKPSILPSTPAQPPVQKPSILPATPEVRRATPVTPPAYNPQPSTAPASRPPSSMPGGSPNPSFRKGRK
jgi:hypothetical protein